MLSGVKELYVYNFTNEKFTVRDGIEMTHITKVHYMYNWLYSSHYTLYKLHIRTKQCSTMFTTRLLETRKLLAAIRLTCQDASSSLIVEIFYTQT